LLGFFGTVDSTTPGKPILPENTLSKGVWRDPPQRPFSLEGEVILQFKELFPSGRGFFLGGWVYPELQNPLFYKAKETTLPQGRRCPKGG